MKKIPSDIVTYHVPIERIKSLSISKDVVYVTDKQGWSYKFIKDKGFWLLDKIHMKRRYRFGKSKSINERHHDRANSRKRFRKMGGSDDRKTQRAMF